MPDWTTMWRRARLSQHAWNKIFRAKFIPRIPHRQFCRHSNIHRRVNQGLVRWKSICIASRHRQLLWIFTNSPFFLKCLWIKLMKLAVQFPNTQTQPDELCMQLLVHNHRQLLSLWERSSSIKMSNWQQSKLSSFVQWTRNCWSE